MPKFTVEKSQFIPCDCQTAFETIRDYGTWTTWSPWLSADPDCQVTVTENANEVGAVYNWKGDVVGSGEIEHKSLNSPHLIEEELRMFKPFPSKSRVLFQIRPAENGCLVTWTMHGSMPVFLFWMIPQIRTMIGMDYERGLKKLKDLIELGEVQSTVTVHGVVPTEPVTLLGIASSASFSEIGPVMEKVFGDVQHKIEAAGISNVKTAASAYTGCNFRQQTFNFISGVLVDEPPATVPVGMTVWTLPAGKALKLEHRGRYDHLGNAWSAANQISRYKKLKLNKAGSYEIYQNDPAKTPAAELLTEVFMPLRS